MVHMTPRSCRTNPFATFAAAAAILLHLPLHSHEEAADDLVELPLEDLMGMTVSLVSRHEEPMSSAAAAVAVVTGEQIRAAGAKTIPDALRLIPGMQVAQLNADHWAISVRGFNALYATKLQVLVDGRSVYSPLFSGVHWESLDMYLLDIERIEVIRGPGGSLWGANAVNGIINIVTRHSRDTHGTIAHAGGGTEHQSYGSVRTGGHFGDDGHVRVYAQTRDRDASERPDGSDSRDGHDMNQAGFRTDWTYAGVGDVRVSGDVYTIRIHGPFGEKTRSGHNLNAQWKRALSLTSDVKAHFHYDHAQRFDPRVFRELRDTYDLGIEHHLLVGLRQEISYGASARIAHDETGEFPLSATVDPQSETRNTYGVFVQDQISLAGGDGELTLGSKFEYLPVVGFEVQPNVRLGWKLGESAFTWAAASRAVRTPSRIDTGLQISCPPPVGIPGLCPPGTEPLGSPDIEAENITAFEWGLRYWNAPSWSADLAVFYNHYDDLISVEAGGGAFGHFGNGLDAQTYGGELSLGFRPVPSLDLRPFYAYLELDAWTQAGSTDMSSVRSLEDRVPQHQAGLRYAWNAAPGWTLGGNLRHVDRIADGNVPAYTELDLRAAWSPVSDLTFALTGRNLLDASHPEFVPDESTPDIGTAELERSVMFDITLSWK